MAIAGFRQAQLGWRLGGGVATRSTACNRTGQLGVPSSLVDIGGGSVKIGVKGMVTGAGMGGQHFRKGGPERERKREIYFKVPPFLCGNTPATTG